MSSSDNFYEVPADLNKPVSTDEVSILHSKETTASQDLTTAESCGQRTTRNEEKHQTGKQSALPDSSAGLPNSTHELMGINGLLSSKSRKRKSPVTPKIKTPKCLSKTLKRSHNGKKKTCVQPSEKKVAASKACADGLDNSVHNSCPEQQLSSPKTKGTRCRHSKKTQNHQTPSDVSTGLHTCTTLSPGRPKAISSSYTNGGCSSGLCTPKRGRGRPRSKPLLSSTPNSDLHPLSRTPSRPQGLVAAGRPRGRPRGRKKKNVQEQPSASPPVKRWRKRSTSPVKSPQEEPSVETQPPSGPCIETQEPEPQKSGDQTMSSDLSIELSLQEEPHHLNHSVLMQEGEEDQDEDEEELPSFLQQNSKIALLNSTTNSDLHPLSPERADNSCTPRSRQRVEDSSPVKSPPLDAAPSRPQGLMATGRPRGRPTGRKKKNVQEQPSASPPVKRYRTRATSPVKSPQEEPSVETQPPSGPCIETQEPEPQKSGDQTMSSDLSIELSLQEEPHHLNHSVLIQEGEEDQDEDEEELPSFLQQNSKIALLSSTTNSDLHPLSPERADNSCTPRSRQRVEDSSPVKSPPLDAAPSRPQGLVATGRPRGRPRGRKKKNVQEQQSASPPVKRYRTRATSPVKSPQEEPSVETQPPSGPCIETQEPEPQKSAQQNVANLGYLQCAETSVVAGMSSSDNFYEVPADLNKPVSTDEVSILHSKETTASQDLTTAESCGQRTTRNEEKHQAGKQSALPDSSAGLPNSTHELMGINGLLSSKSRKRKSPVTPKIKTPKCLSKTLKRSHNGKKKTCVQPSEKKVAASKACADGLDNSVHNSYPEQHLSSPKTKGTRCRHSKKTQNHQTPSDVSTGLHTCTTLSPGRPKAISSSYTNGGCSSGLCTPKRGRGRPRSKPLLSSTPNSDLHPLSRTPSRPQGLAAAGRPRGRPRGRKKKNVQEQPSASPPVKCWRKRSTSPVKSPQEEPSVETQPPSGPCIETQEPEPQKSGQQNVANLGYLQCAETSVVAGMSSKTLKRSHNGRKKTCVQPCEKKVAASKACADGLDNSVHNSYPEQHLSSPKTKGTRCWHSKKTQNHQTPSDVSTGLHTCTTLSPGRPKAISSSYTNGGCSSGPCTPKRGRGRPRSKPLLSSTPNSDLHPLSRTPSRPQGLVAAGRPRGRPRGRKKKNVQEQPSASPPVKRWRKRSTSPVKSPQEEPSVETQPPSGPCIETQEPEPQKSGDQTMSSDLSIELSLQEEPHHLNHSVLMQEGEEDQDEDEEELPSFLQQNSKKPLSISEGLFVWCKLRKYPYWPAVVKSVNHKSKKASIVFVDDYLIYQKRTRKGFCVPLRNLKCFDCEDHETLENVAKEKYSSAITFYLELISDYRIRIGCGSFSGSFIEYCAAYISWPVRKKYAEEKSVLTFPSQEILSEECDNSNNNTEDIVVEEQDELLSKKVLPDRSKAARNRANKQLVDFIIRGKVDNRLLAVMSGRESSKWMQALQKPSRSVVDVYLEDEEQVDKVFRYLDRVCDNTSLQNIQVDRIQLILDVLLPEAIIHAIAGVHNISLEKAEEKYRRGPCFSNRERQEFDMMIEQQMKHT